MGERNPHGREDQGARDEAAEGVWAGVEEAGTP